MTLLPLTLVLFGITLCGQALAADASNTQSRQEACIDGMNDRTAALVAQDWQNLERLSESYLKMCKGVFDSENISSTYEHIATANIMLGNPKKSLTASDACIETYYANTGCHLERSVALIRLRRMSEARVELDRVDKLIAHRTEISKRDLVSARTALDKELIESRLNNLEAQQSYSAALREKHFPE